MKILAIETSCDETAAAITEGRRVLSNVIYSQILIHKDWGGVVPSLAKRAHQEKIDWVIKEAVRKIRTKNGKSKTKIKNQNSRNLFNEIDYIAVTQGPGLAPALEVGINQAKQLAKNLKKKIIAVNHLEGHIYSPFVQNSAGNPKREFHFPYLVLIISGGHTEFAIFKGHLTYQVIGSTLDDAAGEALDKAAKMLNLGYPGGPVIERLAKKINNIDKYRFPRPMIKSNDLNFSFSGLKTSFYYFLKKNPHLKNDLVHLASSFQEAVFDSLLVKTEMAIKKTKINRLLVVGGVSANLYLRKKFRQLIKKFQGEVFFPTFKYLTGDNAAMIGVVAYYKSLKKLFVEDFSKLDRLPRMDLENN